MGEGLDPLSCCINKSEILVLIKCLLPPPELNYHSSASPFTTRPFSSTFLLMFCIPPSVPSHRQSLFPSRVIRLSHCVVPSHRVCNPPTICNHHCYSASPFCHAPLPYLQPHFDCWISSSPTPTHRSTYLRLVQTPDPEANNVFLNAPPPPLHPSCAVTILPT